MYACWPVRTLEPNKIVECYLHKTALHACELVTSDHPFLFPTIYRIFMQYISEYDIDLSGVCVSNSRLLTFLGNEFGELLTSLCVDRSIGTLFHRTKANIHSLLSHTLHAKSSCTAASQAYHANLLNFQVHELVNHKNETRDQSMKLAQREHIPLLRQQNTTERMFQIIWKWIALDNPRCPMPVVLPVQFNLNLFRSLPLS